MIGSPRLEAVLCSQNGRGGCREMGREGHVLDLEAYLTQIRLGQEASATRKLLNPRAFDEGKTFELG